MPPMSEWQPIETAPLDTAVLAYGSMYAIAHYNTALGQWVDCWDHRPLTHLKWWQPLPEAPCPSTPESTNLKALARGWIQDHAWGAGKSTENFGPLPDLRMAYGSYESALTPKGMKETDTEADVRYYGRCTC